MVCDEYSNQLPQYPEGMQNTRAGNQQCKQRREEVDLTTKLQRRNHEVIKQAANGDQPPRLCDKVQWTPALRRWAKATYCAASDGV